MHYLVATVERDVQVVGSVPRHAGRTTASVWLGWLVGGSTLGPKPLTSICVHTGLCHLVTPPWGSRPLSGYHKNIGV